MIPAHVVVERNIKSAVANNPDILKVELISHLIISYKLNKILHKI